jgi:hypothetical protein
VRFAFSFHRHALTVVAIVEQRAAASAATKPSVVGGVQRRPSDYPRDQRRDFELVSHAEAPVVGAAGGGRLPQVCPLVLVQMLYVCFMTLMNIFM